VGEGSRCRLAARHRHATSRHAGAQAARRTRFSASKLPIRHGTPRAKRPPPPPRGGCVQTMDDDGAGTRGDRPSPTKSAQGRDRGEPRKRFRMTWGAQTQAMVVVAAARRTGRPRRGWQQGVEARAHRARRAGNGGVNRDVVAGWLLRG
jgi:hypothetical protein